MDERQIIILHHNGANLISGTTVNALARLDDHGAHGLFLELLQGNGDLALPLGELFVGELGADRVLERLDLGDTRSLVGAAESGGHLIIMCENALMNSLDGLIERVLFLDDRSVDALVLLNELVLRLAKCRKCLLAEFHSSEHVVFGDLLGASLDHGNKVRRTAELKIEIGVLALFVGGVDDKLASLFIATDADAGKRTLERNAAHRHGKRCTHDVDDVKGVFLIGHKRSGDNVNLVAESIGEARADGTVDHARGKGGLLGRTTLALEITTGNTSGGVHLLVEVHRQREEVVVLALFGNDNGIEHGGIALLNEDGTGCLLGKLS